MSKLSIRNFRLPLVLLLSLSTVELNAEGLPLASPEAVGLNNEGLSQIDDVVAAGLEEEEMPGCVVCIGRQGQIAYLKAYGYRQIEPEKIEMTIDTVFDMASITKPIASPGRWMLASSKRCARNWLRFPGLQGIGRYHCQQGVRLNRLASAKLARLHQLAIFK